MQDFRQLRVWQNAHQTTLGIYRVTTFFPNDEIFGLTAQIRRCATSVASNIAEGCGRGGDKGFARFLQIALGSASELEYYLVLTYDLGLLKKVDHDRLIIEVTDTTRMLAGLIRKLTPRRRNG